MTTTTPTVGAPADASTLIFVVHAIVFGTLSATAAAAFGSSAAIVVVVGIGAVAAAVDARTGRIPDRLVALAGVVTIAGTAVAATSDPAGTFVGTGLGAVAFAGPLLVAHLVSPTSLGFGDVKLAAVTGAALGLVDARLALVALCVATGTTAVVGLVRRRAALPLGPGLVAGTALALVGGLPG